MKSDFLLIQTKYENTFPLKISNKEDKVTLTGKNSE